MDSAGMALMADLFLVPERATLAAVAPISSRAPPVDRTDRTEARAADAALAVAEEWVEISRTDMLLMLVRAF